MTYARRQAARRLALLAACLLLPACRQQMADQPSYHEPLEPSRFFTDGRSARPLVPDTVPRGYLREDAVLFRGRIGDDYVTGFPIEITPQVLERGRERYNVFCAVCHDRLGTGRGKIVERGFTPPPAFYPIPERGEDGLSRGYALRGERMPLTEAPPGYLYTVIMNGYGAMPDYETQITPLDRWAIVAYVRVLQLSRAAEFADLPPAEQEQIRAMLGPAEGARE